MRFTAEKIAAGLDKSRPNGKGFVACCPSHPDNNPSLSITDADDGTVLVYCHSGCTQDAVIAALKSRGLWPDATPRHDRKPNTDAGSGTKRLDATGLSFRLHRLITKAARNTRPPIRHRYGPP